MSTVSLPGVFQAHITRRLVVIRLSMVVDRVLGPFPSSNALDFQAAQFVSSVQSRFFKVGYNEGEEEGEKEGEKEKGMAACPTIFGFGEREDEQGCVPKWTHYRSPLTHIASLRHLPTHRNRNGKERRRRRMPCIVQCK